MSQLTHGAVTYGQKVNTGDFNSKNAEVTIGFKMDEGATEDEARKLLATASQIAISKAFELLALPQPKAGPQAHVQAAPVVTTAVGATKADLAAAITKPVEAPPKATRARKPPAVDPAAMTEDDPTAGKPNAPAPAADDAASMSVEDEDLFSAEAPAVEVRKITDDELTKAITRRNEVIKSPPAIRQLIASFVAMPGQARDIPQEKRADFMAKLAALPEPGK